MKLFDLNPVSIKEFRQLTRSRHIRNALMAFLALQIAVAMIVINAMRDSSGLLTDSETGERMFDFLAILLNLAVMAALPGNVFWRMLSENKHGKTDPLLATNLTTGQFVNGKLFSGVAMVLFFMFAALPFLTLSYLLRGITIAVIMEYVFLAFAISCVLVHVAVLLASMRLPDALRKLLFTAFFGGSASYIFALPVIFTEGLDDIDPVWTFLAATSFAAVVVCAVLRAMAIAQLAPPHTDRAVQLRVTSAIAAVTVLALAPVMSVVTANADWFTIAAMAVGLGVLALLFMECSGTPGLARRALIDRPKNRFKRFLRFPLATGPVPGILHALVLSVLSSAVFRSKDLHGFTIWLVFAAAFLLLARASWTLVLKRFGFNARFVGVFGLALYALALILYVVPNGFTFHELTGPNVQRVYTASVAKGVICVVIALLLNLPEILPAVRAYFGSGETAKK